MKPNPLPVSAAPAMVVAASLLFGAATPALAQNVFNRVSVFPVFQNSVVTNETAAEIVAATDDGNTLVYSDSPLEVIGFIDISDPVNPAGLGTLAVGGEPTSVGIAGDFALVAVNTSPDLDNPSGELRIYDIGDINNPALSRTIDLGGQPDAVAVSPDGNYAAIAIENERDEDETVNGVEGGLPQLPGGTLVVLDIGVDATTPASWAVSTVDLPSLGLNIDAPSDPEPEYVDINSQNVAAVSLQENNGLVLVDLTTTPPTVTASFSAGTVDLNQIDATEEDPALISLTESLSAVPREPDGLNWVNGEVFATADEGDLFGGSRGFTLFDTSGNVVFSSGNTLEHEAVRLGHYPDSRSGNKGNEPENAEYGNYGGTDYLFVGSERSSVIFVYTLSGTGTSITPTLQQALPAGVAPEGLLAIPSRNLFVAASEEDARDDAIRSVVNIYRLEPGPADYPDVVSSLRPDNTPIPWGALSALVLDPTDPDTVYSVYDSYYQQSRIFTLDISGEPAVITAETPLLDSNGLLANVQNTVLDLNPEDGTPPVEITLVNPDNTVNLDPEGIAIAPDGNFWIASEGDDDPFFPNMLVEATPTGEIVDVVLLPDSTRALIDNNGFEGVAVVDNLVYAEFQRDQWDNQDGLVRIGRYDTTTGEWGFFFYPTQAPTSPNGGWVGLSELTYIGNDTFLVIERDNQAGVDATIKQVYQFNVGSITPLPDSQAPNFPVATKQLVVDLLPQLQAAGGRVLEKVEGLALLPDGNLLYVIDNDGTDDSNGQTLLLRTPATLPPVVSVTLNPDGTITVSGDNLAADTVVLVDGQPVMTTQQPDGDLLAMVPDGLSGMVTVTVQDANGAMVLAETRIDLGAAMAAVAIPTLSVWSMLAVLTLLLGSGGYSLRNRIR